MIGDNMKKTYKVEIWSSEEEFPTDAKELQYEIYENISGLDTVKVTEYNLDIERLYKSEEDLIEDARGICPDCDKGLLGISLYDSFKYTLTRTILGEEIIDVFNYDVIECDRCRYVHIEESIP